MIERFGISIFWLFLGCVKVLIVALDVVVRFLVWISGECDEEASRESDTLESGAECHISSVDSEPNRESGE